MAINYYRRKIYNLSTADANTNRLFEIFKQTLKPDMSYREFLAYYQSIKLDYIDVSFVELKGVTIAFCAAAFYKATIAGKSAIIGRAATGVLPSYRGNMLPKWKLYFKFIRYKLFHPGSYVILSAYVANPIIYAMICKYTGWAYPKENQQIPDSIVEIKNNLLHSQGLKKKEGPAFVIKIHFNVHMGVEMVTRIYASKDKHLLFFLSINPLFQQQFGVVTIIPVTMKNCVVSSIKFLYFQVIKFFQQFVYHIKFIVDYVLRSAPSLRN